MATPLKIVTPVTVTDSVLYATDVPETDYAEWSAATTYTLGQRVIRTSTHKVYESAQGGNLNNVPEATPLFWIEVSPTNSWKMFDASSSSATAKSNSISVTLRPGVVCNALAVINLKGCLSVRVRVEDATYGTLYDQTTSTAPTPAASDWWSWFFGLKKAQDQVVVLDFNHILTADVLVDFTGGTDLSVGVLLVGQKLEIGTAIQYGASLGIQDYSRKETNEWGDTVLIKKAFAKKASFTLSIPNDQLDMTMNTLSDLRATPCLWVGVDEYKSTTLFGFYREFGVVVAYPTFSDCSLDLEELV